MRFWDSSAIVPLVIKEKASEALVKLRTIDPAMVVWWGTETECLSALARREREGSLSRTTVVAAEAILQEILHSAYTVLSSQEIRHHARRLLMTHPLRAGDALQLAGAVLFAEAEAGKLPFVTLDKNLAECAEKEGFPVLSEIPPQTNYEHP